MGTRNLDNQVHAQAIAVAARSRLERAGVLPKRTRWNPHTPWPRQAAFLAMEDQLEVFYGGAAGGGKSDALLMAALEYVDVPGYSALLLRRTFPQLENAGSLIPRSKEWLMNTDAEWSERNKRWTFPVGSTIQFGHVETKNDVYNYQSAAFQYVAFDELTQFDEFPYTYLFSRLRRLEGYPVPLRMRSGSNPGNEGALWVYERFIEGCEFENGVGVKTVVTDDDVQIRYFVPAKLADNPSLDAKSYTKSLNQLDPVTRAQLLNGDWSVRSRGNIFPMWDERYHVITWSEFARVFGTPHIPHHWRLACGHDWGADHPAAVTWVAAAAENSALPGTQFVYRGRMFQNATDRDIATEIKKVEAPHMEASRMVMRLMSHEALGARNNYQREHGLTFDAWKPDRIAGISLIRDYLQLQELERPHPFRPQLKGRPKLYFIVEDGQGDLVPNTAATGKDDLLLVQGAKDDDGLVRHRAEMAGYAWATTIGGLPTPRPVPQKTFNDAMDSLRGIAARWFAPIQPLSDYEKLEHLLPEELRYSTIMEQSPEERAELMLAREVEMSGKKRYESVVIDNRVRSLWPRKRKPLWL